MDAPFLSQVPIRQPQTAPAEQSPEMGVRVRIRYPFISPPYVYPIYPAPSLPFYWQNYPQAYPYYPYPSYYGWRPFNRVWFW